jgi:hypothetical protein
MDGKDMRSSRRSLVTAIIVVIVFMAFQIGVMIRSKTHHGETHRDTSAGQPRE